MPPPAAAESPPRLLACCGCCQPGLACRGEAAPPPQPHSLALLCGMEEPPRGAGLCNPCIGSSPLPRLRPPSLVLSAAGRCPQEGPLRQGHAGHEAGPAVPAPGAGVGRGAPRQPAAMLLLLRRPRGVSLAPGGGEGRGLGWAAGLSEDRPRLPACWDCARNPLTAAPDQPAHKAGGPRLQARGPWPLCGPTAGGGEEVPLRLLLAPSPALARSGGPGLGLSLDRPKAQAAPGGAGKGSPKPSPPPAQVEPEDAAVPPVCPVVPRGLHPVPEQASALRGQVRLGGLGGLGGGGTDGRGRRGTDRLPVLGLWQVLRL